MIPPVVAELRANFGDFKAKVVDARGEWDKTTAVIRGSAAETALAGSQHQRLAHDVHGGTSAFHLLRESIREALGTVNSGVGAAIPGYAEFRAKIGETSAALRAQRAAAAEAFAVARAGAEATVLEIARLNVGIAATEQKMLAISPASSAFTIANDKVLALRAQVHGLEADLAASAAAMKANSGGAIGGVASKGKILGVGAVGATVAAGAAAAVIGYEGVKEALKEQAAMDMLRQAVEKTKASWKAYREPLESVTSQMRVLGFTDVETAHSVEWLTRVTGNSEKALNLAGLAANIARAKHIDLAAATVLVSKVANGKIAALGRMGLATKDANGHTLTAKQGIDLLGKAFGGAANAYSHTLKGQLSELKAQTEHVFASIGNKMVPGLERLGEGFRHAGKWAREHLVPPLRDLVHWFKEKIAPAIGKVITILHDGFEKALHKVTEALHKHRSQVSKVREVLKVMAEFVAEKVMPVLAEFQAFLWEQLGGALAFIIGVVGRVVDAFQWLYVFLAKLPNRIVKGFLQPVVNTMLSWARQVVDLANQAFSWVPWMGDQLAGAKRAVDNFATSTAATLQSWADTTAEIGYMAGRSVADNFDAGLKKGAKKAPAEHRVNISGGYSDGLSNEPTAKKKPKKDSAAARNAKKKAREAAAAAKKRAREAQARAVAAAKKAAAAVIAHLKAELVARNEVIRAMQVQAKLAGKAAQDLTIQDGNVLNRGNSFQQQQMGGGTVVNINVAGSIRQDRDLAAVMAEELRRMGRQNSVGYAA